MQFRRALRKFRLALASMGGSGSTDATATIDDGGRSGPPPPPETSPEVIRSKGVKSESPGRLALEVLGSSSLTRQLSFAPCLAILELFPPHRSRSLIFAPVGPEGATWTLELELGLLSTVWTQPNRTRTRTTKCRMGGSAQKRLPGAWAEVDCAIPIPHTK